MLESLEDNLAAPVPPIPCIAPRADKTFVPVFPPCPPCRVYVLLPKVTFVSPAFSPLFPLAPPLPPALTVRVYCVDGVTFILLFVYIYLYLDLHLYFLSLIMLPLRHLLLQLIHILSHR